MRPERNKLNKTSPVHGTGVSGEPGAAGLQTDLQKRVLACSRIQILGLRFSAGGLIAWGLPCADPSPAKHLSQSAQLHIVLGSPERVVSSLSGATRGFE